MIRRLQTSDKTKWNARTFDDLLGRLDSMLVTRNTGSHNMTMAIQRRRSTNRSTAAVAVAVAVAVAR